MDKTSLILLMLVLSLLSSFITIVIYVLRNATIPDWVDRVLWFINRGE